MSTFLAAALIFHVVLGIVGLGALQLAFMQLIRKQPPWNVVEGASWVALLSFLLSWATGAYYYVLYYGTMVKPRIVSGEFAWAHQIFMEAKEHIFLIVPFLVLVVLFSVRSLRRKEDDSLKSAASTLAAVALTLGVLVAAGGIIVSGAVR